MKLSLNDKPQRPSTLIDEQLIDFKAQLEEFLFNAYLEEEHEGFFRLSQYRALIMIEMLNRGIPIKHEASALV